MHDRSAPFPEYSFVAYLKDAGGMETPLGGFSDAVGLPQKVTGLHTVGDVTLKRGVVNSSDLSGWIAAARSGGLSGRLNVVILQRGAANTPLKSWQLTNARPVKYTGPALGGKGEDVAMEELVLAPEGIELVGSEAPPK
jgi:phage tail-like protein